MSVAFIKPKRLGNDNYIKPKQTMTDKLTREQIAEQLEDYKQVADISKVPVGSHVRYFSIDKEGKKKYRPGGTIMKNDGLPKYIILTNNVSSWSVQVEKTIFYRKMTLKEIKQEYIDQIKEKEKVIASKNKEIAHLQSQVKFYINK